MRLATLAIAPNPIRIGHTADFVVVLEDYAGDGPIEVCISVAPPALLGRHCMLCQTVIGMAPTIVTFRSEIRARSRIGNILVQVLAGDGVENTELRQSFLVDVDGEAAMSSEATG